MKGIRLLALVVVLAVVGCGKKTQPQPQPFSITEENYSDTSKWTAFLNSELTESECYFTGVFLSKCRKVSQSETTLICEIPDVEAGVQQIAQDQKFQLTIQSLIKGKEEQKIYPYTLERVLDFSTTTQQVECNTQLTSQGLYSNTEFLEQLVRGALETVYSFSQEKFQGVTSKEGTSEFKQFTAVGVGEACFVTYKGAKLFLKIDSVSIAQDVAQVCSFDSKYQPVRITASFVLLSKKSVMISAPFVGLTQDGLQCTTDAVFDGVQDNQSLSQGQQCQISTIVFSDRNGSVGFYDPKTHNFVKLNY